MHFLWPNRTLLSIAQ